MDIKLMLRNRRKELGLTMKQVSEMVNVSESTISRWESGKISNMTRENISMLAKALKISPSSIMGWESEGPGFEDGIIDLDTYDELTEDELILSQTGFSMKFMRGDDVAFKCYLTEEQKNVLISMVKSWGVICHERKDDKNV
ncbi:MAG: helix-turn-helix transcriptional regulator [Acutalibacteraceae bacterium]|nr:helix-turn-helix transcriptional regulator [Acutalibacteraceae bacterium]